MTILAGNTFSSLFQFYILVLYLRGVGGDIVFNRGIFGLELSAFLWRTITTDFTNKSQY